MIMSNLIDQYIKKISSGDKETSDLLDSVLDVLDDEEIPFSLKPKSSFKDVNKRMEEIEKASAKNKSNEDENAR